MLVYTGEDGKEQLQDSLDKVIEEIEDVRAHGLRFCGKEDTCVCKNLKRRWKAVTSGERRSEFLGFFIPDICSQFGRNSVAIRSRR